MGKPTGFKEFQRETPKRRDVKLRILDWNEVYTDLPEEKIRRQGARSMRAKAALLATGSKPLAATWVPIYPRSVRRAH